MKKTLILTAALLLFCATSSIASDKDSPKTTEKNNVVSTYSVNGKVIDQKIGETLVGATVTVNGKKVFTDLEGNFTVDNIAGENCEIQVNMISYKPQVIKVSVNESKNIQIALKQ